MRSTVNHAIVSFLLGGTILVVMVSAAAQDRANRGAIAAPASEPMR